MIFVHRDYPPLELKYIGLDSFTLSKMQFDFTPDEEIGEGTLYFELDKFPCDFAYTVDGGKEGEINYEKLFYF